MALTTATQESLVALLCFHEEQRTAGLIRALVPLKAFEVYYRDIVESVLAFRDKFEAAPGEHTLDLVQDIAKHRKDSEKIFERITESLFQLRGSINADYVIGQAKDFARQQRVKSAIMQAVELVQQETPAALDEAERVLGDSLRSTVDLFDPGLSLADEDKLFSFLDEPAESFPTGIPEFDKRHMGPTRKEMFLVIAPYGRGKSWALMNLGKHALMARKKVLHVSLEMSVDKVMQRYLQMLFAVSKREEIFERQVFDSDEFGSFVGMSQIEIEGRPAWEHPNIKSVIKAKLKPLRSKGLLVKQFPTGALTVRELEGYLNSLEMMHAYVPDLLIVDYPDLMQIDSANLRVDTGRIYRELRGLAIKRNIALAIASQSNRGGEDAKTVTGKNIAEDYSKMATVDIAVTYSQTEDEKPLGLARLRVDKGRNDEDKFTVLIAQNYSIGQFCLDSVRMVSKYWDQLPRHDQSSDDHENAG